MRIGSTNYPLALLAIAASLATMPGAGCSVPLEDAEAAQDPAPPALVRTEGPHVFLITISTARRDRLSVYGHERPTTPYLERLARDGVVYDNCISAGTWTFPSHASLFTGQFVRDHGADASSAKRATRRGEKALGEEMTLLAEVLRDAGYLTVGLSNNAWLDAHFGMQQGFDEFHAVYPRNPDGDWIDDGASVTNDWVLQWLDRRERPDQRFFFYMNYVEPTMPYAPPAPFDARFLPPAHDPDQVAELRSWRHPREMLYMLEVPGEDVTPEQFELLAALYEGELAYVDSRLGEIVAALDERGLLEDTLLIVTSDQGEHFGEHHLMHHKMSVYEPLIRVPLILRLPGRLKPGRVQSLVQTHDLFATILSLAGVPHELPPGTRTMPVTDAEPASRQYAFAEAADPTAFLIAMRNRFPGARTKRFERSLRAVRGPRFKYIWGSDGTRELYDLALDPAEAVDLSLERPALLEQLHGVLEQFDRGESP